MVSNNAVSLLHAREWGLSKYKFHQLVKPREAGCSHQREQKTWPKAVWPVVFPMTPLVVFLLVSVWGNEILSSVLLPLGTLSCADFHLQLAACFHGNWRTIYPHDSRAVDLLYLSYDADQRESPPCSYWEDLGQVLTSFSNKVMNNLRHQDFHRLDGTWDMKHEDWEHLCTCM